MPRLIDADAARAAMLKIAEDSRPGAEERPMQIGTGAEYVRMKTAEAVAEWLDALPTVEMPGWISVKDRLPEYTGWYLTYHHKINLCVVSWFTGDGWEDGDWVAYEDGWVSHWMPLPEDPKEVSGDDA